MSTTHSATASSTSTNLPEGWRTVRFGDFVRNLDVYVSNPIEAGLERYIGLDHLDPESLHIKRWGLIADGTSFTRKFIKGQVLFGKRRAYQRKAAVADFDGICSGDILVFEPKSDDLLPDLLPFIVQSEGFYNHALGTSAGSLSPRTRWRDLAEYEFPLPPKDEQRRIADILWAADEALHGYTDAHVAYKAMFQALVKELTTTHMMHGGSTAQWQSYLLKDLAQIRRGASPRPIGDSRWFGNGPGWVRISDVTSSHKYLRQTEQYLSDEGVARSVQVGPGDVIMSICATIGRPAILAMEACIHDGFVLFANLQPQVYPEFLYYRLLAEESTFTSKGQPGTQANLNTSIVGNTTILLPTYTEQIEIVELLSKADGVMQQLEEHVRLKTELKSQLLQHLLNPGQSHV